MSDTAGETILTGPGQNDDAAGEDKPKNIAEFISGYIPKDTKWKKDASYRVRNDAETDVLIKDKSGQDISKIYGHTARIIQGETLEQTEKSQIELEREYNIKILKLNYNRDDSFTIQNLTARRISINHNAHAVAAFKDRNLFIPAFGSRTINGDTLLDLDYMGWESQGLITIAQFKPQIANQNAYTILGLTSGLLAIFILIAVPLAWFGKSGVTWNMVGIGTLIGLVLTGIAAFSASRNAGDSFFTDIINWIRLLPGIMIVLATGIVIPLVIIYVFGDGYRLIQERSDGLDALGRILQAGFISIASLLPAFLFYLFGRQQVEKQKENFYRDAMLLDPNVWSRSEAENKYNPLLNSVFDSGNSPFSILLLVFSTAFLVMGWIITLAPTGIPPANAENLTVFFKPDKTPFTLGFLGVYFFTINMIYRRYVRADLTPKTYAYTAMRLLVTMVLVWAVSTLPQFPEGSVLESGLLTVAFVIGIFPESGLTLIQEYFTKITSKRFGQKNSEHLSLTNLEGINLYDQARLLEEGIDNIENLAHHNLMELIVRTRIPTQRLIDMFDQSILYLHLGPGTPDSSNSNNLEASENSESGIRSKLKELGIRTATDLIACHKKIKNMNDSNQEIDLFLNKLDIIITSLEDDEWFNYVKSWRRSSALQDAPIDNPYQFYNRVTSDEQS